jgi:hypothetical protein
MTVIESLEHERTLSHNKSTPKIDKLVVELEKLNKQYFKAHSNISYDSIKTGIKSIDFLHLISKQLEEGALLISDFNIDRTVLIRFFTQLATTCYNIYVTPSLKSLVINLGNLLVQYFPAEYINMIIEWFFDAIFEYSKNFNDVVAMAKKDEVPEEEQQTIFTRVQHFITSLFDMFGDERWSQIGDFFIKLASLWAALEKGVAFESFDMKTISAKWKDWQKVGDSAADIFGMMNDAYLFVVLHWKSLVTGDWSPLFLGKQEAKDFEAEVLSLGQQFEVVMSGRLDELKERYKRTEEQFESSLASCIKRGEKLAAIASSVQQKMSIARFLEGLTKKQSAYYALKTDAPTREEPYGLKLWGASGVGKSTLLNFINRALLDAYDHDHTNKGLITAANIYEAFESNVEPQHKIINCDDVGNNPNQKANFDYILNYINTTPRPLKKAGVEEKGKKFPMNDACVVTCNPEDMGAESNCLESIFRRFRLHAQVKIRPEFQNGSGGVIDLPNMRFDIYEFVLKRFSHVQYTEEIEDDDGNVQTIDLRKPITIYKTIPRDEWQKSGDIADDFKFFIRFLVEDVKHHRVNQKNKAAFQKELSDMKFCDTCKNPKLLCLCSHDQCVEAENFDPIDHLFCEPVLETQLFDDKRVETITPQSDEIVVETVGENDEVVAMFNVQDFLDTLPTVDLTNLHMMTTLHCYNVAFRVEMWRQLATAFFHHRVKIIFGFNLWCQFLALLFCYSVLTGQSYCFVAFLLVTLIFLGLCWYSFKQAVTKTLQRRSDQLSALCETTSEFVYNHGRKLFASFIVVYSFFKIVRLFRTVNDIASEDTTTYLDKANDAFRARMQEPPKRYHRPRGDERDYKEGYTRLPPQMTDIAKTTSSAKLQERLERTIRVVVVKSKGQIFGTVNGTMYRGNVLLVPNHIIPESMPFDIETTTQPGLPSAKTKDQNLGLKHIVRDYDNDTCMVHLPSAPAGADMSHFYPTEYPSWRTKGTILIHKTSDNELRISKQAIKPYIHVNGKKEMHYSGQVEKPGLIYGTKLSTVTYVTKNPYVCDLEFNSFAGLCGSPYIDHERGVIYGFHVAGYAAGSTRGWLNCLLAPNLEKMYKQLDLTTPQMILSSQGHVRVDQFDSNMEIVDGKPHYLRDDGRQEKAICTYFGKVHKNGLPLEERARPPYIPTVFEGVKEEFGEPKSRPPSRPNDIEKGMITLNKLQDPNQHYRQDLLELALNDLEKDMFNAFDKDIEGNSEMMQIYSQQEALDGIGVFGLSGMPNSTSAGVPLNVSKKKILKKDPLDESLPKVPREFEPEFGVDEVITEAWEAWKRGERSEAIFKASSKVNELLPIKKALSKVRKFYGSPIQFLVPARRVLPGLIMFCRRYWKETECMVGVNPTSKEWKEFRDHLSEFSILNMIAGDFSSFDTCMAQQVTTGVANIIVKLYKRAGRTEEEIQILRGCLSDICNPNVLFMGDLYNFANMNPSGQPITVQLNGLCNSVMMRYVYYALRERFGIRNSRSFSQDVRLGTYGDDNAMAVHDNCTYFTHTLCQEEFEKVGVKYTMADKDAESKPYITMEELSFLKRGFRWHDELKTYVAPIEMESIEKKFHYLQKPTESPLCFEEQFAAYVDSAQREMALRPRSEYNDFDLKIGRIIAKNPSLKMHVFRRTYDEILAEIAPDYTENYKSDNNKLFVESGLTFESCDLEPFEQNEIL